MGIPLLSQRRIAQFWSRVHVRGSDDCWDWLAGRRKRNYGGFKIGKKAYLAHRIAHFLHTGEWPAVVRHTCDRPPCCNPGHLLSGEQADNMRDAAERGLMPMKLSPAQVREVRQSSERGKDIARRLGVSTALVSMIRSGKVRKAVSAAAE